MNIHMITDPPRVDLSLTNAGPGNVVKVGDTVYLQCNVLSNPPVENVYWKFQVQYTYLYNTYALSSFILVL